MLFGQYINRVRGNIASVSEWHNAAGTIYGILLVPPHGGTTWAIPWDEHCTVSYFTNKPIRRQSAPSIFMSYVDSVGHSAGQNVAILLLFGAPFLQDTFLWDNMWRLFVAPAPRTKRLLDNRCCTCTLTRVHISMHIHIKHTCIY